jgi:hypothetical protein
MASEAQIAANRANAQRSTGPTSEAGKAASARNALKHGLCAAKLTLDEEDGAEFEALRADYVARYRPAGLAEARLVDRIAQLAFRRERGSTMEAAAWRGYARGGWILDKKERGRQRWHEDGDPTVAARATPIMNGVTAELLRITLYEGRMSRELQRLTAELEALQHRRSRTDYKAVPVAPAQPEAEAEGAPAQPQPRNPAAIGFVPSPLPPPPAGAPLAAYAAWSARERRRLDAEASAFAAAQENPMQATA